MTMVKIEASATANVKVESDALADLFEADLSPMDVDIADRKPVKNDVDDVKDELESEEDDGSLSLAPESSKSRSNSPRPAPKKKGPQLIGHLPRAEKEAMKTFTEIPDNFYQYQTLGRSREALESMTCDCSFTPGVDDPDMACGYSADCINRLTQVECVDGDCRCKRYCRNQRMQRKQYANIEIVQTEMKGFGLRAGSDIPKDGFIYEYIGDVVSQPTFAKRMREYAEEGIKHFYFMMLQKDEFLDATKRGGIGRFANHSCNPNCYVSKWTVGSRVRMGIYAKRSIRKDEELTFNYNVDRYGHDAQSCYCGEPNCVGVLGGKTQTDVAAMDDLYLDALGISDEVAKYGLKGSKKKKSKKLDEDYCPELKPLIIKDVEKVIQALSNTRSRIVLIRLLGRLRLTNEAPILRRLMRLRATTLLRHILEENMSDAEVCGTILESLRLWPFEKRNKIEASQIEETVKKFEDSEQEHIRSITKDLLEAWSCLGVGYRISKRSITEDLIKEEESLMLKAAQKRLRTENSSLDRGMMVESSSSSSVRNSRPVESKDILKEAYKDVAHAPLPRQQTPEPIDERKKWEEEKRLQLIREREEAIRRAKPGYFSDYVLPTTDSIIKATIMKAEEERQRVAALEAQKKQEEERLQKLREEKEAARQRKKEKKEKKERMRNMSSEEKEAMKVKRLQKLVGEICVKQLNHHCRHKLDRESFKKRAKEMTEFLVEKEKKSSWFAEGKLDSLPENKAAKMKQFSNDFIKKLLHRMKKEEREKHKGKEGRASTSQVNPLLEPYLASTSQLAGSTPVTPNGPMPGTPDTPSVDDDPGMSMEEALGLNDKDYADADMDMDDDDDEEEEKSGDPSPASEAQRPSMEPSVDVVGQDVEPDVGPDSFGSAILDAAILQGAEEASSIIDTGKGVQALDS